MVRFFSKKEKGFSLLEVVVAVFIFSLIMVSAASVFGKAFQGYRTAKAIQKDLENAQYAMNLMAKTVRTSKIITSAVSAIRVYNYSQLSNKCIEYKFENNKLKSGASNIADADETQCDPNTSIVFFDMTTGTIAGSFSAVPSSPTVTGKVTISMKVCPSSPCPGNPKDEARIQTTVSLRN